MKYVFRKRRYRLAASLFDAIGYIFFKPVFDTPIALKNAPHILISRLDHVGDVILASAIPQQIKQRYPGCKISFLVSGWAAPVLKHHPCIDEVIVWNAPWFERRATSGPRESLADLAKRLKRGSFDVVLSLRGDLRENYIFWKSGIPVRVGYGITGGGFFLTHEVSYELGVHEAARAQKLLRMMDCPTASLEPSIRLDLTEIDRFYEKVQPLGWDPAATYVGLHVGAGNPAKEWPMDQMENFVRLFCAGFPSQRLVLVGADLDRGVEIKKILERVGAANRVLNLIGQTSLRELFAAISRCKAFIGADSGPTHAASALGVKTIFLYSGTNRLEEWGPLSLKAQVLTHAVSCAPCFLTRCSVPGHPCMSQIRPDIVAEHLQTLLS